MYLIKKIFSDFNFKDIFGKNAAWLLTTQAIVKAITFLLTIFIARSLGPAHYGLYVYGLTIFGLVSALSDFGLTRLIFRDFSVDKTEIKKSLSYFFALSYLVTSILLVILIFGIVIFEKKSDRGLVAIIMVSAVLPYTLAAVLTAVLNAKELMKQTALSILSLNLLTGLFSIISIMLGYGVFGIAVGFVIAHFIYFLQVYFNLIAQKIQPGFKINFNFYKKAVFKALPYGILTALGLIYFRIDSILLTFLRGEEMTGYYGAAFRFLDAAHIIPLSIMTALFPRFANLHKQSFSQLESLYFRTLKLMFIFSIPIFLIFFAFSDLIIKIAYGSEFEPSGLVLKILSFTTFFMFLHVPGAHLLFATEKFLKELIILSIFTVSFNIFGNLILIPLYGIVGASVMTVISEIISFIIFYFLITKRVFKQKNQLNDFSISNNSQS